MSNKDLAGKTALITGGSRGIGLATSLRLAARGAFVLVHYGKNDQAAKQALEQVQQEGGNGALIKADLLQADGVSQLFKQLDVELASGATSRKLNILVNNAGIGCIQSLEEMKQEQFDALFELNVKAPFFIVQQALSRLADGGRVINVSSFVTRMAIPAVGAYAMTKGALNTMTLWLAKHLGARRINVNAVAPGVIDTEMNAQGLSDPNARAYMEALSVFGRVGQPSDVADVIAFLASDDSRWISGQCLDVSGGSFLG